MPFTPLRLPVCVYIVGCVEKARYPVEGSIDLPFLGKGLEWAHLAQVSQNTVIEKGAFSYRMAALFPGVLGD
jgi:hypothetical protein